MQDVEILVFVDNHEDQTAGDITTAMSQSLDLPFRKLVRQLRDTMSNRLESMHDDGLVRRKYYMQRFRYRVTAKGKALIKRNEVK